MTAPSSSEPHRKGFTSGTTNDVWHRSEHFIDVPRGEARQREVAMQFPQEYSSRVGAC